MNEIKLRDYQRNGANELFLKLKTNKNVLFQLATGGGKTFVFSFFVKYWLSVNEGNVTILVHRKELLDQTISSLGKLGIKAEGITKENKKPKFTDRVFVSMVQTLSRRLKKDENYISNTKLLIVDECHRNDFNNVFPYFEDAQRIGFSATPISANKKKPLKDYYNDIVCCAGIKDLIKEGNLTKNKTYTIKGIDKKQFKKDGKGDFSQSSMMDQFNLPKMTENVVNAYEKKCLGEKTLIFNVGCEHSINVCNTFLNKGYDCRYLDGKSKDREEKLKWFKETDNAILCNIDILTTGFDEPSVKNIIVNRSTTSLPLWLQMTGRGGRLYPGKESFNIIDLGGNASMHGDWSETRDWNYIFNDDYKPKDGVAPVKDCPECGYLNHSAAKVCGDYDCNYEFPTQVIEETEVFELELLEGRAVNFDVKDEFNDIIESNYKPHKAVHNLQKELIKSLRYVNKNKYEKNKDKIINDLKKAFYPKYKEFHELNKDLFKLHPKNLSYWYKQLILKLDERF